MTQPQPLQRSFHKLGSPGLMAALEASTLAAESRQHPTAQASRHWASRIVADALARHGSRSQCDLDLLMRRLNPAAMTLDAFIHAADAAASDLVDA